MPLAAANGIELYHETFGDERDPLLLLISGLGAHATGYDDAFCAGLAERFWVVRYDNRDVGLSTHLPDGSYTLSDMAADAAALIEHLGRRQAHVLGCSMGGMIAQTVAIEHRHRVATLISVMSTTGDSDLPPPAGETLTRLLRLSRPVTDREQAIEQGLELTRLIASPTLFDEDYHRRRQTSFVDRAYDPAGVARQLAAVTSSPPRTAALRELEVPALVIHGTVDPLVAVEGGRRTAEALRARYIEIAEMGHDLPPALWPRLIDEVATFVAETRRA